MKRLIVWSCLTVLAATSWAQTAKEEIALNPHLSASNYLAYPTPTTKLTPAPAGYSPFYISHYGRHGSRYMINGKSYTRPLRVLTVADSLGRLTPLGRTLKKQVEAMQQESLNRLGELTELGAEQHQQIAHRMYERFPEVFAGDVHVDAKSTIVIRCILSMENELQELVRLNPRLRISHDASMHDMYYMNLTDTAITNHRQSAEAKRAYEQFEKAHKVDKGRLLGLVFTDTTGIKDAGQFGIDLFRMASILQNSEIRHKFSLYSLFTSDELYNYWATDNAGWYISYGACPLNGAVQPFTQRNLLRNIITTADSCLRLDRPGATLRFGHETMVLPLTCLLNLNGYGQQTADLNNLERQGWINYRIFPMGANIQFIFYRKPGADILFKVLLNENEATLPDLKPVSGPYYRWSDFRSFFLKKLDGYQASRTD